MAELETTSKLPGLVYRLGWVSFFADVCSEMAYPIMPLFILTVLRADKSALGWIEGIALAVVNFMRGWSGFHSDKTGRRAPFVQAGYLTSGLSKFFTGIATVWTTVLFARILDRFGKGVRTTARDAMLADAVTPKEYGRAYGLHQGMDTAGAFVGVIITFVLLLVWEGNVAQADIYRRVFFLAVGPGAVAWFITLTLKDKPKVSEEQGAPEPTKFRFDWKTLSPPFWRAVMLSCVFQLANSSDVFLMVRAGPVSQGGVGLAVRNVVLAYALYNLVFSFLSYPVGKLSDRIGRWPALFWGWILYAIVYFGFGHANTLSIWFMFAVYGASIGAVTAVNKALVADYAPKEARGTAMGIFQVATGVATLIASPITGWVWDRFGAAASFDLCAGLALLSALLIPLTGGFRLRPQAA